MTLRREAVRIVGAFFWVATVGTVASADETGAARGLLGGPRSLEVVWQIGDFDRSAREFALAPNDANRFAERFGQRVAFQVGQMTAAEFPFIHPSKADTRWGGSEVIPFAINFSLQDATADCALLIALVDTHERLASTMRIAVNGQRIWERQMPLGRGRAYYGEVNGAGPLFAVSLGHGRLRAGENQIEITLTDGSWVAYDALALVRLRIPQLEIPGAAPLRPGQTEVGAEGLEAGGALLLPLGRGTGVYVAAPDATWARTTSLLPPGGYRAEFDLRVLAGSVTAALELPEGARDLAWALSFSAAEEAILVKPLNTQLSRIIAGTGEQARRGWIHCAAQDTGTAVALTVTQGDRTIAASVLRVPAPEGRLKWLTSDAGAEFAIANLRWEAVGVAPRERAPVRPIREVRRLMAETRFDEATGRLTIANTALKLVVETREGLNPQMLSAVGSGKLYADDDYIYAFGDGRPRLSQSPKIVARDDGAKEAVCVGRIGDLEIEQRFLVFTREPAIEEQVIIRNQGKEPLDTSRFACGFGKRVSDPEGWFTEVADSRLVAIPYKRDPETGEFCDYRLSDLAWQSGWYHTASRQPKVMTPAFGSEGWAWTNENESLLILKYNPQAMEWSLVEPQWREPATMVLRFGGAGRWKRGDPEGAARLAPGAEFRFGVTRYELCPGGWQAAFAAFRRFMESKGHKPPRGYDPPVHWNELYDNPLWWEPDTLERRAQFYRRQDMEVEARKAAALGCEALYLDPGWDTSFASSVWAAERLGPHQDFARLLREQYGLALAFHTPLAGWSDIGAYPVEARRMDASGSRLDALCSAAPAYIEEKARRLIKLCDDGAAFLMFDGSGFTGECWDATHGHSLPLTRQEHCLAYKELTRRVKERHPEVLIELHDPIVAGVNVRYAPTYFLHGGPRDFDELWGYEYMWDPMDDIYSGRALSLYYVNLAYSIPIYLHIDLRKDNENALEFWWYASACRHLGVGGRHLARPEAATAVASHLAADEQVWNAHKQAMQTYRRLKRFYTQGVFYGLDETVHAHTLPEEGRCIVNVFNLADVQVERELRFRLADIGLQGSDIAVAGAQWDMVGDELRFSLEVPARGHRLVEIQAR